MERLNSHGLKIQILVSQLQWRVDEWLLELYKLYIVVLPIAWVSHEYRDKFSVQVGVYLGLILNLLLFTTVLQAITEELKLAAHGNYDMLMISL